jgi:glycosyltransferase involved in cell wall biosynthesis
MRTDAMNPPAIGEAPDMRRALSARAGEVQCRGASGNAAIVIATINRLSGDTGVHTHTAALMAGMNAANLPCVVQSPFSRGPWWLPLFAMRRIIGPLNRTWGTCWYRRWHGAALASNLRHYIRRHGAPAVLAQCPVSAAAALAVRSELGGNFPVAMVCHFNFSEANEYRDKGELGDRAAYQAVLDFEHDVLGNVDRVIYVSQWARRAVEQDRGIATRGSSVIWNGIAPATVDPFPREQLGLRSGDLALINVGTLEPRKNQFGLIDLFARIAQRRPDARLLLVGDGSDRSRIQRRISELQLESKITLLGLRRDVPALLACSDLYVHYAAMENCPLALIEAARAALPIAAAPGGGAAELLEALGGVTLNPADADVSFDALRPLLENASLRRKLGNASRAGFDRSFTREAMVAAYIETLSVGPRAPAEGRQ